MPAWPARIAAPPPASHAGAQLWSIVAHGTPVPLGRPEAALLPVLLRSAATSHKAHVLSGSLRQMQSSHSSLSPPECKKRQGSGGTATAPGTRHYLSAKSSTSTVDLLLTEEFHRKESFLGTREAATPSGNIFPKGFRAFPCYICTNRETTLGVGASAGCPRLAARRWLGRLSHQPPGERQPCSQEAEAPHRTVLLRCSLER